MKKPTLPAPVHAPRSGLLLGLGAYGIWGILPIYFKQIGHIGPFEIVAHRVLWSVPLLALLLLLTGRVRVARDALTRPGTLRLLLATALLIGANWLLYIYAVTSGHILAGSLAYYLNPLANVLLGRIFLKERLTRLQWAAVALAGLGTAALAIAALEQLWLALALCLTFAVYGFLRKIAPVDSAVGLTIETSLLLPFALAWLLWGWAEGQPSFGASTVDTALLLSAGIVTATPLLLFTAAARALPYSTLGMLQFIAPTLQFLIAVALYGEAVTTAHAIAFGAIWTALGIYVSVLIREGSGTDRRDTALQQGD
jgi:chloramphenicol-sensitive protein RarD